MERFINEYANWKIKRLKEDHLMRQAIKGKAIWIIEMVVNRRKRGLLSVDETIQVILNAEKRAMQDYINE